ncbi:ATP-grasp fold amidoligase family protein [Rhabdonatronobacter sediminivivens]|nr:ATP-grasp fold amidoligase family protein [Rhabdonatronobacter sediminivivens]
MLLPVVGKLFFEPAYFVYKYFVEYRPWLSDRRAVERLFEREMGYRPDLDDPKTFNEKIQWIKLHDRCPQKVICADKFRSREFVAERAGKEYTIPCLMVTEDPEDITVDKLPDQPCVIKTNHDQGTVFIVKDKAKADLGEVRGRLRIALRRNLYHAKREWHYGEVPRRIVVEPLLVSDDGNDLRDYRAYCFNGWPEIIQVESDRFSGHKRNIYKPDWRRIEVEYGYPVGEWEPAPACLDELLDISRKLAAPFLFVRVDFYIVNGRPKVGELTFLPASGLKPFSPSEFDRELGDMLDLPEAT